MKVLAISMEEECERRIKEENAEALRHSFTSIAHLITHFGHSLQQLLGLAPPETNRIGPQGENLGPMSEEEIEEFWAKECKSSEEWQKTLHQKKGAQQHRFCRRWRC